MSPIHNNSPAFHMTLVTASANEEDPPPPDSASAPLPDTEVNSSASPQKSSSLDDIKSRIFRNANGNFGAARVLIDLLKLTGVEQFETTVGKLESQEISGHLVYMRFKYDCGENLLKFIEATDDASANAVKSEKPNSSAKGDFPDNYAAEEYKSRATEPSAPRTSDALQKPSR